MHKVLVIEDNDDVTELLKAVLSLKDYQVVTASNGKGGLNTAKKEKPDLIVLDLTLPDIDGLDLCRTFKTTPETQSIPIFMLTGRTGVLDRVKGLETGADDYLIKPFDTLEFLARVKVLLRRGGLSTNEGRPSLKLGNVEIQPDSYRLAIDNKQINSLTPKEFDILYVLMRNSPKPVPREDIFQVVWGKSEKNYGRAIDFHIVQIRRKLGAAITRRIKTIPGKGYLFSPE